MKNSCITKFLSVVIFLCFVWQGIAQDSGTIKLVTPGASSEAAELFAFLHSISGMKTLTGQHDQPLFKSAFYQRVYELTGEYPAIKGMDFGFSEPNTLDGINFRQDLVDEAIEYWKDGTIITLMWHAVPPNMDEPVTFSQGVQSKLTDKEWNELLTADTELNRRWQSQVDIIAFFLKQLRDAHVPIIWRPYHEMNGNWFWWGGRSGDMGYRKLYTMLFDRLVNYHKINNLIWVFNANEISGDWMKPYADFYPGQEYVDILATDVYRNNFQISDYDQLLALGEGKLIALGEVGKMPTAETLLQQPKWVWFMTWVDRALYSNTYEELKALYKAENTLTRKEIGSNQDF
jgi:mannan endo-1,4-beta-mannosidase